MVSATLHWNPDTQPAGTWYSIQDSSQGPAGLVYPCHRWFWMPVSAQDSMSSQAEGSRGTLFLDIHD